MTGDFKNSKTFESVAGGIASAIIGLQNYWAKGLARIFNPISKHGKKLIIITLSSFSCSLSLYFLVSAVVSESKIDETHFHERTIEVITDKGWNTKPIQTQEKLLKRILEKARVSDSLGKHITPGLLDSIAELEKTLKQKYER